MTNSHKEPHPPGRGDLSPIPDENSVDWLARSRKFAVIDPELARLECDRLDAALRHKGELIRRYRQRAEVARRWIYGTAVVLVVCVLLALVTGLTGWLAVASGIALAISFGARQAARNQERAAQEKTAPGPSFGVDQAVLIADLDEASRNLLARAQRSIDDILSSADRQARRLKWLADEATLREKEWLIAKDLRSLSMRRAQLDAQSAQGPRAAAAQRAHWSNLSASQEAIEQMVVVIERYAARVELNNADQLDQRTAEDIRLQDDAFRDLAARAAAFEHAIREVEELADQELLDDQEPDGDQAVGS